MIETRTTPGVVDAELLPFVQAFQVDMQADTSHVNAAFATLTPPTLGLCESWSDGNRYISVDRRPWDAMSFLGREQLMNHELGHCVLELKHDNRWVDTNSGIIYGSIMNQYWFGETWFYSVYRSPYKVALKNNALVQP